MDLRLSTDPYESFRIFQGRMLEQYLAMSTEFNFLVIDANQLVEAQQAIVRELVSRNESTLREFQAPKANCRCQTAVANVEAKTRSELEDDRRNESAARRITSWFRAAAPRRFYGHGIPGVDLEQLAGKLIVVEGADGSGRSTQIAQLVEWLEGGGHATVQVGLKRSTLVSEELEQRPGRQHSEPHHAEPVLRDRFCGPVGEHHSARA